MIDRLQLSALLLACGALSLVEGCAPTQGTAPPTRVPAPPTAGGSAPSLLWKTRGAGGTTATVEVHIAALSDVCLSTSADANADCGELVLQFTTTVWAACATTS